MYHNYLINRDCMFTKSADVSSIQKKTKKTKNPKPTSERISWPSARAMQVVYLTRDLTKL